MVFLQYVLILLLEPGSGFVIAPPWANPVRNPCSSSSWQLVFWPPNLQCYKIFSQGPCPETQELGFSSQDKVPVCRCPQNLPLLWEPTGKCYSRYSRGPCQVDQYVDLNQDTGNPICRTTERCEPGRVFWPPEQRCFQLYTQGPCHKGDLLIINPLTTEPYCGCDSVLLNQYYYSPLKLCYEQLSRGPCEEGLLFTYNHTSDTTQCSCSSEIPNYSPELGQCYELESKGPCGKGQIFVYDSKLKKPRCECKDNYVYWEKSDSCFREYTTGPCRGSQFIIMCLKITLVRAIAEAVVAAQGIIRTTGTRTESVMSGTVRAPCLDSFFFKYNRESRSTECFCDTSSGFVFWNETQGCYRTFTQGPCPDNSWLVPGGESEEVYCECKDGFQFSPEEYKCKSTQLIQVSGHRFENLWSNVAEYMEKRKMENLVPRRRSSETKSKLRIRETRRRVS